MNMPRANSAMRIRRPPEQTREENMLAAPTQSAETGEKKSRTMAEKFKDLMNYSSLLLENKGPVARDHVCMFYGMQLQVLTVDG